MHTGIAGFVIFDHDNGTLDSLAVDAQFRRVDAAVETPVAERLAVEAGGRLTDARKDWEAAAALLADSWTLAFVHIEADPWKALCERIVDERVLVRFSTQGFQPTPPGRGHALALHCLKRIDALKADDLEKIKAVCSHASMIADLRAGLIPPSVQALIAFEEPHRLKALHILLQGVLALWASDPGHESSEKAARLLGVASIPSLPGRKVTPMGLLWRGLGLEIDRVIRPESGEAFRAGLLRELGLRTLGEKPAVEQLINHILKSKEADTINPDTVLRGFEAIDQLLCKS